LEARQAAGAANRNARRESAMTLILALLTRFSGRASGQKGRSGCERCGAIELDRAR